MGNITENFNYDEVKKSLGVLEGYFSEFAECTGKMNQSVNNYINNGDDSAIYGILGKKLLDTWNDNASTFKDFYANFEEWSVLVCNVAANNKHFEEETINLFKNNRTTGGTMGGVEEAKQQFAAGFSKKTNEELVDNSNDDVDPNDNPINPEQTEEEPNDNPVNPEKKTEESSSEENNTPTIVTESDWYDSEAYANLMSSSYSQSQFYLDEAQTILYDAGSGKILYPDGTYEIVGVLNSNDLQAKWKEINNYVLESDCVKEFIIPDGYKIVEVGDWYDSESYANLMSSSYSQSQFYLDEAQTILYDAGTGKIFYSDGTYETVGVLNPNELQAKWKEINKYVYESDCEFEYKY